MFLDKNKGCRTLVFLPTPQVLFTPGFALEVGEGAGTLTPFMPSLQWMTPLRSECNSCPVRLGARTTWSPICVPRMLGSIVVKLTTNLEAERETTVRPEQPFRVTALLSLRLTLNRPTLVTGLTAAHVKTSINKH